MPMSDPIPVVTEAPAPAPDPAPAPASVPKPAPVPSALPVLLYANLAIPSAGALNAAARPRPLAAAAERSLVPLTYGQDRVSALIVNVLPAAAGSTTLLVQCLWGFACHAISDMLLNDVTLPAGSTATHYTGSQATPDAALVSAFAAQGITYADTLQGYAYSVLAMPSRAFEGQLNVSALVQGRRVYDPRHDLAAGKQNTGTAVLGSPGVPPAGWGGGSNNGISRQIVATGIEGGIPYIDVRWYGTATAITYPNLSPVPINTAPALPGTQWKVAAFVRLISGTVPPGAQVYTNVNAASGGTYLAGATATITPTGAPLQFQRAVLGSAYTLPAGTTNVYQNLQMTIQSGTSLDVTLRWGMPMLWSTSDTADPLAYSANPALALADFCASGLYGLGRAVDWASVATAANACEALVGSPAEARRLLGVSFTQAGSAIDVAEALRAYAGCWLLAGPAGLRLLPDTDAAPVASYSHAAGDIADLRDLQRKDLGSLPTAVEVLYSDTSELPWREGSALASLAGAGTTRPWRLSQVRMPGIQRHSQAYREAVERLNKLNQGDLSCTLEVFDIGIRHELADIVQVTHPLGLVGVPMRVVSVTLAGPGRWALQLVQHSPGAYSAEVVAGPAVSRPGLANGLGLPANVAGLSGSVSKGRIVWSWTPAVDPLLRTELRLGGTTWDNAAFAWRGLASQWQQVVSATGTYTLRARHLDEAGQTSATTSTASVTVAAGDLVIETADLAPAAATEFYDVTPTAPVTITTVSNTNNSQQTIADVTFTPGGSGVATVYAEARSLYSNNGAFLVSAEYSVQQVGASYDAWKELNLDVPASSAVTSALVTSRRFNVVAGTSYTFRFCGSKGDAGDVWTIDNIQLRVEVIKR